jgi:hypothetical protein
MPANKSASDIAQKKIIPKNDAAKETQMIDSYMFVTGWAAGDQAAQHNSSAVKGQGDEREDDAKIAQSAPRASADAQLAR